MDVGSITALIISLTGVGGLVVSYKLGKRGQNADEKQQAVATRLQERIASFDEMESLNDRLGVENKRLRDLLSDAESIGDLRLARQARRCRDALDETTTALAVLQAVVLAEVSKVAARDAVEHAKKHVADDHADLYGDEDA